MALTTQNGPLEPTTHDGPDRTKMGPGPMCVLMKIAEMHKFGCFKLVKNKLLDSDRLLQLKKDHLSQSPMMDPTGPKSVPVPYAFSLK